MKSDVEPARTHCRNESAWRACFPGAVLLALSLPALVLAGTPLPTSQALVMFPPGVTARDAFLRASGAGALVVGQGALANSVVVAPGADAGSLRAAGAIVILAASGFLCGREEGNSR